MYDPDELNISTTRQAELLSINRTSVYTSSCTTGLSKRERDDIAIMHRIDEIYTAYPFYGYRRIHVLLSRDMDIGKKKVLRLMRKMGIHAIYPKRNLSKLYQRQYIHPYLLRNLVVTRAHHVWAVDITYVRMGVGFMYLFVIIDLYSRYIVDYELSSTLEKDFVLRCLNRAYEVVRPEIQNSDQGSHFTNETYIQLLKKFDVKISMDSKGRALDNIFVERFFRSLKYEEIYLNEYDNPRALRKAIASYIDFYNRDRPHQALDYLVPGDLYHERDNDIIPA